MSGLADDILHRLLQVADPVDGVIILDLEFDGPVDCPG